MAKKIHEIRDPIHVFIRLDSDERRVLDAWPFQRLRHIHQLGMTYLVYPGATHRRFEHSLGVMELASRIDDVVTAPENIRHDSVRQLVPGQYQHQYWRLVIRMAALCHDLGHAPFSHAAEGLLPEGWSHERLSMEIILHPQMRSIWEGIKVQPADVAKLAVGPNVYPEPLSDWGAILAEIIVGDAFGADRMDYLLRDSYHAGVAYGRFDHFRLIDTLRILPQEEDGSEEPTLGVEQGGLQSAEALLWARYFMYTQLYFHPIRRIYDIHLRDFLKEWLPGGRFPTEIDQHLALTDNEVTSAILRASQDSNAPGHEPAHRITSREHFRLLYERNPGDQERNPESVRLIYEAVRQKYGAQALRRDSYTQRTSGIDFPVYGRDGRIQASRAMSRTLKDVPTFAVDYVFIDPNLREQARRWLDENLPQIIPPVQEEQ